MSDLLNADLGIGAGGQDFATIFQNQLITPLGNHGAFADNASFKDYLYSLGYQSGSTPFPGLNGALISVSSISSQDNASSPITISDTRDQNGNGVLTTQVTNSTTIDIDLTFNVDQTKVKSGAAPKTLKLELGKQASLLGFAIDPAKGEGCTLYVEGVAQFHFDFGLTWPQKVNTATTYANNNPQPNPVVTPLTPTIDPSSGPVAPAMASTSRPTS